MTAVKPEHVGAVILAAGNSTRMNSWKPFLQYDKDNTFIDKLISTFLSWGCREIVLVINRDLKDRYDFFNQLPEKVTCIVNEHLEFERFYSVKLGLEAIRTSSFCFIQNVDNPFIHPAILDLLYKHRRNDKYIVPVFGNRGGHPVLLNRNNMDRICRWNENSANFKAVLGTMECLKVEMPDERVLININSPEEYQKYFPKTINAG